MGAQGVAPKRLSCMFELVRCFKSIRAYGFDCFRFQGCSGVLIVIEFEFNFECGFLVVPKWMRKDRHQGGGAQVDAEG